MTIEGGDRDVRVRVDTSEDSSRPSGGVPGTDPLASDELGVAPAIEDAELGRLHARLASRLLGIESTAPRLGRFVLLDRLGEGGMGVVYSAYDDRLDRRVAIKLLHAELDGEGVHRRLVREAQAMAKLAHPNVATVFEVGEHNGRVFVAMELIKGATLRRWRTETTPGWAKIVATYVQAACAWLGGCTRGLSTLGQALARVHDWAAAREALERVVVLREEAHGLDAPQLAFDLPHLARACGQLGDILALEHHLDRALAIAEHTYGAHHPQLVGLLLTAADVAASAKQDELSLRYYGLGMQVLEALGRTDTMQAAWILGGSAVILQRGGRAAEAAPRFRASIAIKELELGAEHMQVVAAVRSLAFTELDLGDHADAERLARRAVVGMGKLLGEEHAWAAVARVALGEALLGLGRRDEAIAALEESLRVLATDDATHRPRATAALARARE